MAEMDFVPSERKPGEDWTTQVKSSKSCDSAASTHAQDVFQLRTEVTEDLSPKGWNTDLVEANHDLETGAKMQCSGEAQVEPSTQEKVPETSRKQKEVWYVLMTMLYFVYRSQEESIFTPKAFSLRWNDLVGLIFIVSFLLTRKPSYLVYAINPFRNVVMILLQTIWPRMKAEETNPEYYRNISSASIQLCSACAIWFLTTPQPIGVGTRWALEMPCLDTSCLRGRMSCLKKWLTRVVNFLLIATGIAAVLMALEKQTHGFHSLHTEDHGWKIILSVVLGVAEEGTWRNVYMADNNNSMQAFTWGVNHIVAGTGMNNPWVYGVVSGSYAFCLGVTPYVTLRFFHHAAVEYFVIDNLVKPEGHPIWLTQSVV